MIDKFDTSHSNHISKVNEQIMLSKYIYKDMEISSVLHLFSQ